MHAHLTRSDVIRSSHFPETKPLSMPSRIVFRTESSHSRNSTRMHTTSSPEHRRSQIVQSSTASAVQYPDMLNSRSHSGSQGEELTQQLGALKEQLAASKGVLDSGTSVSFSSWLDMCEDKPVAYPLEGRYRVLTSRMSAGFGESTSMINLCAVIGAQLSSQVKLLKSTMMFGASKFHITPRHRDAFERRDHIYIAEVGLEGYIYVPGVYRLLEDGLLEVRTRGVFLLPASNNVRDLTIWKAWLKTANVGVDDLGNAGKHLANYELLDVLYNANGLLLIRSHNQQLHVLEKEAAQ